MCLKGLKKYLVWILDDCVIHKLGLISKQLEKKKYTDILRFDYHLILSKHIKVVSNQVAINGVSLKLIEL